MGTPAFNPSGSYAPVAFDPSASFEAAPTADYSSLTSNPKGEGTYKMASKDGQSLDVPYSNVPVLQSLQGHTFASPDEQARFEKDAKADPRLPTRWNALTNPVGGGGQPQGIVGGALQIGGQAINTIAQPIAHPIETAKSTAQLGVDLLKTKMGIPVTDPNSPLAQMGQGFQAATKGDPLALENLAGQAIGTVEGGRALAAGGKMAAPYVADAANAVAGKVVPSVMKENAAGLLQSVAHDANQIPVKLDNAGDAAFNLMKWQDKTQLGPTLNKFLNRITNPKLGPLTYEDARDYYQLLGKMSADETMKMSPPVKRDLVQMVVGLKQDIGNAADQVGQAADYYKGLGDYAKASRLQDWYDTAKKYALNVGAGAVGAGGLATLWKYVEGNSK